MTYCIDIQQASESDIPVSDQDLTQWASLALRDHLDEAELTIRLVDQQEMIHLNYSYRDKAQPTNVLAFPCILPEAVKLDCPLLGDLIICPQVLSEESQTLTQGLVPHWAHIVIHGVLHLLGYDHIIENDAVKMQAVEIKLLAELGYNNPYEGEDNHLE